jgi:hypothetical protein
MKIQPDFGSMLRTGDAVRNDTCGQKLNRCLRRRKRNRQKPQVGIEWTVTRVCTNAVCMCHINYSRETSPEHERWGKREKNWKKKKERKISRGIPNHEATNSWFMRVRGMLLRRDRITRTAQHPLCGPISLPGCVFTERREECNREEGSPIPPLFTFPTVG